jgi:menaquinone-dependent protoporphyrinogen oxidase
MSTAENPYFLPPAIGGGPDATAATRLHAVLVPQRRHTMAGRVLVAYGTKHGSTLEVADAVAATLRAHGLQVETLPAASVDGLEPYAGVVVGGAIYMGRWHLDAMRFLERHREALASLPVAVFGMGPRTMEAHDVAESEDQLAKALDKVPEIEPFATAVFGGVVDPKALRFPFNRLPASDARNWAEIHAWSGEVAAALHYGKAASGARDHRSELQQTPR